MEICTNDTDRFDIIQREFLIWRLRVWGHTKAPLTTQDPVKTRGLDPHCAHRTDFLNFCILEIKPAEENSSQWNEISCPNVKTDQTNQEEESALEADCFGFGFFFLTSIHSLCSGYLWAESLEYCCAASLNTIPFPLFSFSYLLLCSVAQSAYVIGLDSQGCHLNL